MRRLLLLGPVLLLAACGSGGDGSPPQSEGNALREKINTLTLQYNSCLSGAGQRIDIEGRMASTLADEVFKSCRGQRDVLFGEILKFRRLGHGAEPEANSKVSAEQSIIDLEADIRQRLLVELTQRKLADEVGNNAAN